MGNIWYNEPKSLDVAFDVIGDIVLSAASQQYGGFTVPSVDLILEPYAEKSYAKALAKYISLGVSPVTAEEEAYKDVKKNLSKVSRVGNINSIPWPAAAAIILYHCNSRNRNRQILQNGNDCYAGSA